MNQPTTLNIYGLPGNARYTLARGPIRDWLRDEKIPAQHSATMRGWYIRTERIGDVIARAELAGKRVRMRGPVE